MPVGVQESMLGLREPIGSATSLDGNRKLKCPACGYINQGSLSGREWSALGVIRSIMGGLETLIGLLLAALLGGFALLFFFAGPLALAYHYFREGDFMLALLVLVVVGSYTSLGVRAVVRQELGPGVYFACVAVLVAVAWAASRLLF